MPFTIIKDDIRYLEVDAIVNSTNGRYKPLGASAKKIHKVAGPELGNVCRQLAKLEKGAAAVTDGFNLKAKYLIHTNAPTWFRRKNCKELLAKCYESCFNAAKERNCESIALPIITVDSFGCPKEKALRVAVECIRKFLLENETMVYLVVSGEKDINIDQEIYSDISSTIIALYKELIEEAKTEKSRPLREPVDLSGYHRQKLSHRKSEGVFSHEDTFCPEDDSSCAFGGNFGTYDEGFGGAYSAPSMAPMGFGPKPTHKKKPTKSKTKKNIPLPSLENMRELNPHIRGYLDDVSHYVLDESFSEMLFRLIDERGLSDIEVYKKACVSKQIFSNIKSSTNYTPTNQIVLAFAIALELDLEETKELLSKAGYALSPSRIFDIIVKYFIENEIYDIYEINITLFKFDQKLLGSK